MWFHISAAHKQEELINVRGQSGWLALRILTGRDLRICHQAGNLPGCCLREAPHIANIKLGLTLKPLQMQRQASGVGAATPPSVRCLCGAMEPHLWGHEGKVR